MDYKDYAQKSREAHRKLFGKVELKTDCIYYTINKGEDWCRVCTSDHEHNCLRCQHGVCYFYQPKED